jgi:BlaI family transcriptional regulator, penicillinase repressor
MSRPDQTARLGRRERQLLDAVYRLGKASVRDVLAQLPDPPSYSAVRAMLNLLEQKGHLRHEQKGNKYLYLPTVGRERARTRAMQHVLRTFFDGSPAQALVSLFDATRTKLSQEELDDLAVRIDKARREGR